MSSLGFRARWHQAVANSMLRGIAIRTIWFVPLLVLVLLSATFPDTHGTWWHFLLYLTSVGTLLTFALRAVFFGVSLLVSLFRRSRPGLRTHRAGQFVIAGATVWLLVIVIGALVPHRLPTSYEFDQFDRSLWLSSASVDVYKTSLAPRQRMLASTISGLKRKNRAEIEDLLGPSLEMSRFREKGVDLIYFIGPYMKAYTFGVDAELLLIRLSEDGRFERYELGVQSDFNPGQSNAD